MRISFRSERHQAHELTPCIQQPLERAGIVDQYTIGRMRADVSLDRTDERTFDMNAADARGHDCMLFNCIGKLFNTLAHRIERTSDHGGQRNFDIARGHSLRSLNDLLFVKSWIVEVDPMNPLTCRST